MNGGEERRRKRGGGEESECFLVSLLCLSLPLFFQRHAPRRAERRRPTRSAERKRSAAASAAAALSSAPRKKTRVASLNRPKKCGNDQKRKKGKKETQREKTNESLGGRQLGLAPPFGDEILRGSDPRWLLVAVPRSRDPKVPGAGPGEVKKIETSFRLISIERRDFRQLLATFFSDALTTKLFPNSVNTINHRTVPCVWMLVTSGFLETRLIKVSVEVDLGVVIEWSSRFSHRQPRPRGPRRPRKGRSPSLEFARSFEGCDCIDAASTGSLIGLWWRETLNSEVVMPPLDHLALD